VIYKH